MATTASVEPTKVVIEKIQTCLLRAAWKWTIWTGNRLTKDVTDDMTCHTVMVTHVHNIYTVRILVEDFVTHQGVQWASKGVHEIIVVIRSSPPSCPAGAVGMRVSRTVSLTEPTHLI